MSIPSSTIASSALNNLSSNVDVSTHVTSSLGQNFDTSTYVGEIIFAIIVATLGLVLFALLIGNMQVSL